MSHLSIFVRLLEGDAGEGGGGGGAGERGSGGRGIANGTLKVRKVTAFQSLCPATAAHLWE